MRKGSQPVSDPAEKAWTDEAGVEHSGPLLASVGEFDVVDCRQCGFRHVLPIPTTEMLTSAYAHEYYSKEKPLYIERYLEDREWWDSVYDARYATLEALLGPGRRRILDIGSGPGLFLARGRERGWRAKGVEPSVHAAAYSRDTLGLDVSEVFLDSASAAALGRFDAISLSLVLEHLPDPRAMLRIVHGLLEPGGVLCLVAPNDFNPIQAIAHGNLGLPAWWIAPPHHLNFFDRPSLQMLLQAVGFEVVHDEVTFPIDLFLLMGDSYIGNDALGRECHRRRMAFELNLVKAGRADLLQQLYARLATLGIGRELVFFARKA
jgi:SAM-dependent methyltransferase